MNHIFIYFFLFLVKYIVYTCMIYVLMFSILLAVCKAEVDHSFVQVLRGLGKDLCNH